MEKDRKDYIKGITPDAERRFLAQPVEVRADGDGEIKTVTGYAALYNSETDLGYFREEIAPGAFDDNLNDDVRALFNHDPNYVLARSKDGKGTLELFTDERGLGYRFTPGNQSYAKDLVESMERGDVSQSSFAFTIEEEKWTRSEDGSDLRTILKVKRLYDVSPVTYPAYSDTEVGVRSLETYRKEIEESQSENEAPKRMAAKVKLLKSYL